MKLQRFVDFKPVLIKSGNGGDGAIAFARSIQQPLGPPSGGNGGNGSNVWIVASTKVTSLNGIQNKYIGPNGKSGQNKHMHGANAPDLQIIVPTGTTVKQINSRENEINLTQIVDRHFIFRQGYRPQEDRVNMLMERVSEKKPIPPVHVELAADGDKVLVAKGGQGGLGNPHFVTPTIKGPGVAGRGERGSTVLIELELKLLANVGLVGLPNAGKSSLLKSITNAKPLIAPYPFTTINPYVGTIEFADYWTMTVADIPGIIKGASQNRGLGHSFLRHIEKNAMFLYVLDLSGKQPAEDLKILMNELEQYKPGITLRPSVIAANKADLPNAKENLQILEKMTSFPIVPISAKYEQNLNVLLAVMRQMISKNA